MIVYGSAHNVDLKDMIMELIFLTDFYTVVFVLMCVFCNCVTVFISFTYSYHYLFQPFGYHFKINLS